MAVVDLTGIKTELELMPEDIYPATLSAWTYNAKSKSSNDPNVSLEFEVSQGEYEGRKLFRVQSLGAKSLWSFKRALIRLGTDPDELEGPIDLEDIMPPLVGAPCHLKVGQHEYDGEMRNNVSNILPEDYAFSSDV